MAKTTYDIKRQMENEFGKDFVNTMNRKKQRYDELQKELKEAQKFEDKVKNKLDEIRHDFVYIHDNHTIYPDETCRQYQDRFARECVENEYDAEQQKEESKKIQIECLEYIKDDAERLLKIVNEKMEELK